MVNIAKQAEPELLKAHKEWEGARFSNLSSEAKSELRSSLLAEQGFICAYCQERLELNSSSVRIEHVKPQSLNKNLELDYINLLACCSGGTDSDESPKKLHCDASKENYNEEGFINPANTSLDLKAEFLYSRATGFISSANSDLGKMIQVLNLNTPRLARKRELLFKKLIKEYKVNRQSELISKAKTSLEITNGKKQPFCGLIWFFTNTFIS